jgi:hypothetical protein
MALQDLTPQLRTRLSRMERAVGWFVLLATAALVFGFGYYIYHTAQRKGWFLTKAPYFTLIDRATGLRVGDPVKLMGFEAGQITRITAQPPYEFYNVYVEFEIKSPFYGYLWTEGSRARISGADFLGKRELEVTKGVGGTPAYVFSPLKEIPLAQLAQLPSPETWKLAEDVYEPDQLNILVHAMTPLRPEVVAQLKAAGRAHVRVLDTREERKFMTAVWNDRAGRFEHFGRTNLYWLRADETPALTEQLEKLLVAVETALPGVFALTNQIALALDGTVVLTSNFNAVAVDARPAVSNLTALAAQLRGEGALGDWLLSDGQRQLGQSLTNVNTVLTNADAALISLSENLARSLENLAGITSNLNSQVQANTNLITAISDAIVHTDEFVQGLRRHWLLRSAFRTKATNAPPAAPLRSPRDADRH